MTEILVVEDERHIADVVVFLLEEKGWKTRRAEDGTQAWKLFLLHPPALVLLDLGLPGIPGLKLLTQMREQQPDLPVIILTARGEEEARVRGMEAGADDYVCKPFNNRELVARVAAVLRRTRNWTPLQAILEKGPYTLIPHTAELRLPGGTLSLARHELELLSTLLRHPNRIFSRDQLIARMYPDDAEVFDNAVDTVVWRLRRKIKKIAPDLNPVESVYGLGYRFQAPAL